MQLQRINQIVKGKRAVTPDTALRLSRLFGTTPDLWLNAQLAWDLWHAQREAGVEIEEKVIPLAHVAVTRRLAGSLALPPARVRSKKRS
jgi:plasmid maintenance system antidote protein VapI